MSFTREADLHYDHKGHWATTIPLIAPLTKLALVRNLYYSTTMDDLKRRIFDRAVRLHSGEFNDAWRQTEERAAKRIAIATDRMDADETAASPSAWLIRPLSHGIGGFGSKIIIYGAPLYFRILWQALASRTKSRYVLIRSHLTIGYMRHLYATYRGRIHNRVLILRSRIINARAHGRYLAQNWKPGYLIRLIESFRQLRRIFGSGSGV